MTRFCSTYSTSAKKRLTQFSAITITTVMMVFSTTSLADVVEVPLSQLTMNSELSEDVHQTLYHLRYGHYLPNELNDEYSARTLDAYLKLLDPNKIYFTKKDVDKFQNYRYKLDDLLKQRNAEVAFDIFKIYRQRMADRTDLILKLIEKDFDFSLDENINIDRDTFKWAIRENLTRRYQRQRDVTFQLKADEVFEWFMNAYTKELGPHTQYMSHITAENFRINMSLSLEGIGAALQTEQDYTVINRIIPGGPAEVSGALKPEDKIVAVSQDGEEKVNVIGWRLMDVVQMIRGDKGTKVILDVLSNDSAPGSPPESIELIRDVIQLEDQAAKLSQVEIPVSNENKDKKLFSVISIPSFYSNSGQARNGAKYTATTHDVRKLIDQIGDTDSQGLVIDLRGNGGGYLNEAISLTGLFIPQIFAAAIQDYGRGIVVGERSFGKGTVQRVAPLRYGKQVDHESQVKFTTAKFFRVNGDSTQHKGVTPDITLNSGKEDEDFGERSYDNAIPWSQTDAASYKTNNISPSLIDYLRKQHVSRSNNSAAFSLLRQNSQRITDNKETKQLSLNLKKRTAYRDQLENESLSQLNAYRKSLNLEPVTSETRKDNPLPDDDEHWNIVLHQEAARILFDQINWTETVIAEKSS